MKKILILCPLDMTNTEVMMSEVNEEFRVSSNIFAAGVGYALSKTRECNIDRPLSFADMYLGAALNDLIKAKWTDGFFVGLLDYNEKPDEIWAFNLPTLSAQELALSLDTHNKYHTTFNSTITKTFDNYEDLKEEMRRVRDEL